MRFEVVFEAVITMADIRYPVQNGAQYGHGLALSGEIVLPGCTKLQDSARGFGKTQKYRYFSKIWQIIALK